MPAVEVAVVRRSREEHVGKGPGRRAGPRGGDERALRTLGVAHLDEAAEPARQLCGLCRTGERFELEVRRLSGRVGRNVGKPLIERGGTLRMLKPREEVHQAGERRQPSEPASAAPRDAEVEPFAERAET